MKKRVILPVVCIAASFILASVSFIILPETVIIQFSAGGSVNTAPKLLAVLLPFALGAGGSALSIVTKEDERARKKEMLVSFVGIAVFVVILIVNLIA